MSDEFKQPLANMKPDSLPVSRYIRAKEEWDSRIGNARVQAANWRLAALGIFGLSILLLFGLIYQSTKSAVVPYIVQVGPNGEVLSSVKAIETSRAPQDNEIKYFLGKWVHEVRGVPLDIVVKKNDWINAYLFMKPRAAIKMNEYIKQENPMSKVGEETVSVKLTGVIKMSAKTYQVRWVEDVFEKGGGLKETYKMTAVLTVDFKRPTNEKDILNNPLGMYISDWAWAKEI